MNHSGGSSIKKSKRFWLVGASHGIGKSLAIQLLQEGYRLVLSSRNAQEDLHKLIESYPQQLVCVDMDVSHTESLEAACSKAWNAFSGLDYWFYNAAIYEKNDLKQDNRTLFENCINTNYLGFINLVHHLLPYFEQQQSGRWLVNGSISAHFGLPLGGAYSASKAALLNACQSLQPELKQCGIQLQIINHGFVKTRLTAKNDFEMPFLLSADDTATRIKQFMLAPAGQFELKFPWQMRMIFSILNGLPQTWALKLTAKLLTGSEASKSAENLHNET